MLGTFVSFQFSPKNYWNPSDWFTGILYHSGLGDEHRCASGYKSYDARRHSQSYPRIDQVANPWQQVSSSCRAEHDNDYLGLQVLSSVE